jgi:hypothetical protein
MEFTQYTNIKAVIQQVYDVVDPSDIQPVVIEEWAFQALERINAPTHMAIRVAFLPIYQHAAQLPKDAVIPLQFLYSCHTECPQDDLSAYTDEKAKEIVYRCHHAMQWQPMFSSTSTYAAVEQHCVFNRFNSNPCEHTYTIQPNGVVRTTAFSGTLAFAYHSYAIDDCGDIMIPDNAVLLEALKAFCMMKLYERKMNMGVQNALQMYQIYARQWNNTSSNARTMAMMPNIAQLENIRRIRARMIPLENGFEGQFGNITSRDNVITKGHSKLNDELRDRYGR